MAEAARSASWRRRSRSAPTTARSSPGRAPSAWRWRGPTPLTLSARPRWPLDARRGADARRRPQGGQGVIAVIGAGAFGTALAVAQAREGAAGALWGRDAGGDRRDGRDAREPARLPGVALPDGVACVTADLAALARAEVAAAGPAGAGDRGVPRRAWRGRCPRRRWSSAPRASTRARLRLQTEIAAGRSPAPPLAALTGPGFAGEIAARAADGADARLRRRRTSAGALQVPLSTPPAAALPDRRRHRRRARRGAEERHRHRLRHGRGRGPGRIRPGRR